MTTWPLTRFQSASGVYDGVTGATPLGDIANKTLGQAHYTLTDMFLGKTGGALGETCALAILIGGLFLIWKKIISPIIPFAFIGPVFVISVIYYAFNPVGVPGYNAFTMGIFNVLAGGVMFGAFFCATDYVTSPIMKRGKLIFGIGCGALTMMIRILGAYPEGVSFAILLMNVVTPLIDRYSERSFYGIAAAEKAAKKDEPMKDFGFISVSAGDGLSEIFRGVGADYVIEGGQTMNPSTEDILKACDEVNAKDIFILPNNKNIILAANQAKELLEGKTLHVIPSKTIPQGISAMISFSPDLSASDNEKVMSEATGTVKTAEVTYAVRDTSIEGHPIIKNDIMVLGDDGLLSVDKDIHSAVLAGIKRMASDDAEIITLYYGADTKEEDAEALGEELRKLYPQMETEVQRGGQPIYYYFISVE